LNKILLLYKNAYGGLSEAAWLLALIMLINRSGSMVVPFMSMYLTDELKFTIKDAGIILSIFGIGSMLGSYLGGWLTDKFGQFRVQLTSLTIGGLMFIVLGQIRIFELLAIWLFLLSTVTDMLRPANAASVALYAKPENVTRAFSLNRMAVNLGYSIGPAIGGFLAAISYQWLFLADGITCILAGTLFYFFFRNKKTYSPQKETIENPVTNNFKSALHDKNFMLFIFFCTLFAITFFQLIFTLPLYYRDVYGLTESSIGILIGMNGMVVFIFEMVFVYLLGQNAGARNLITAGTILVGISFVMLNMADEKWILYVAMMVLSFAEILAMPFMVTYTVKSSSPKTRGSYMGMYALAYATAFVIAPFMGTRIIAGLGYTALWWIIGIITIVASAGFFLVVKASPQGSLQEGGN
jgi:predicted MFS family arabinose efflux permease